MKIFFFLLLAATTAHGLHLECLFGQWYYDNLFFDWIDTCFVVGVDNSGNSTHIASTNLPIESSSRVKVIDFGHWNGNCSEFGITSLPKGGQTVFSNITAMVFRSCSFTTINGDELNEYENLEVFMTEWTHFEFTRIPGNLFSNNPKLRYAGFRFGQVRNVGEGLLDNLPNLERADFTANTCISQSAWTADELPSLIANLRTQCSENDPGTTTISPIDGIEIGCRYSYRSYSHLFLEGAYTCNVVSINIYGDSNRVVRANGTSLQLEQVSHVDFGSWDWNCPELGLTFLPQGLLDVFPNMTHISLYDCGITSLSSDDLREYSSLMVLDIDFMELARIPGDLFIHNPNLIYAGFRESQVLHVGEDLLINLPRLRRADFRWNPCIDMLAYNTSQLPVLIETLSTSCPYDPDFTVPPIIDGIEIGCRYSYRSDNHLFLSNAPTCNVISINFHGDSNRVVRANGTSVQREQVTHVDFGSWEWNCPELGLTFLPKGLLDVFPNMTYISLDDCGIRSLSNEDFEEYSSLLVLDVGYMDIPRIPGDLFINTPNLIYVGFRSSQVMHVGDDLLTNLSNLQRADFRWNQCISMLAYNSSEIPSVIETLRTSCPDDPDFTVPSTIPTTTPTYPGTCDVGDIEQFVCYLADEFVYLYVQVQVIEYENQNLAASNEELRNEVADLRQQLDNHEARLAALEGAILQMQKRPVEFKRIEKV